MFHDYVLNNKCSSRKAKREGGGGKEKRKIKEKVETKLLQMRKEEQLIQDKSEGGKDSRYIMYSFKFPTMNMIMISIKCTNKIRHYLKCNSIKDIHCLASLFYWIIQMF